MARPRFERLPPERQSEILAIAATNFGAKGFRGTSYNQLLARLGLGKGSAYYYFADKQDLFLTVVRSCYVSFFEGLRGLPRPTSATDYWAFVEAITLRGLEFMRHDPASAAVLRCFSRERTMLDALSSKEVLDGIEGHYVDFIRLGQRVGAVRRDLPLTLLTDSTRALSSAFDQWFISSALGSSPTRARKLAGWFTELTRRLLEVETRAPTLRARARPEGRPRPKSASGR